MPPEFPQHLNWYLEEAEKAKRAIICPNKTLIVPSAKFRVIGQGKRNEEGDVYFIVIHRGVHGDDTKLRTKAHVWIAMISPNGPYTQGPLFGTHAANDLLYGIVGYRQEVVEKVELVEKTG